MKSLMKLAICLMSACGLALSSSAQNQDYIKTVIGGGPNGLPGTNANMYNPYQVAVDAAGNVYVASQQLNRIFKISTTGVETVVAGNGNAGYYGDGGQATAAEMNGPYGVVVDGASPANVYIADHNNCVVRKVDQATGVITTVAGVVVIPTSGNPYTSCGYSGDGGKANAAQFYNPSGLALNLTTNDLYIVDTAYGVVRKVAGGTATGTVTTVAGSGGTSDGQTNCGGSAPYGDGGKATSGYLCNPNDVTVDTSVSPANLFITEQSRCDVREVVGATGDIYQVAGSYTLGCGFTDNVNALDAQLNQPYQMHTSVSGTTTTVQVADYANARVRQFTLTYTSNVPKPGTMTTIGGKGQGGWCNDDGQPVLNACINPVGIAYDSAGNYYLGDYGSDRVRKVTKSTTYIQTIDGWGPNGGTQPNYSDPVGLSGVGGTPGLYYPLGVWADPTSDNVYVGGYDGQAVYVWNSAKNEISGFAGNGVSGFAGDGSAASSTAAELNEPIGIAKDSKGNIYIADNNNCAIRQVNPSGTITTIAGGTEGALKGCGYTNSSAVDSQFNAPNSVAIDAANNIYIADYNNCAIRKITASTSEVSTLAGGPTVGCGYSGDQGPATAAQISGPQSVTLDGAGNVYFSDTNNARVREIVATTGIIQTVAGAGGGYNGDGPATERDLSGPSGVTADASGNLFLSDSSNQILRWVTPTGQLITFAGTVPGSPISSAGFSGDGGPALNAQLYYPAWISRDASGNTYVADEYNWRIRQISPFAGYGLSSANLSFETQPAGTVSDFQPITVSAVGPTTISAISITTGFTEIDDCVGQALTANQTCEIDVYFQPSVAGKVNGSLTISSNAMFATNPNKVLLSGTGAGLKLTGTLAFGVDPLKTTLSNTLTLTNSGSSVTLSKIYLTSATVFTISGGTCPATGGTLASGASCTIIVSFTPTATGSQKSTLVITSNDPASPLLTAATGTGTEVKTSASSIAFGSITYGSTVTSNLTVSNVGTASFTLSEAISGAGFSISSTGKTCTTSLAAGASCVLPVEYDPTAVGSNTGTLTLTTNGGSSPVIPLTGSATTEVSVSATSIAFGSISYGTTATSDLTIKNVGKVSFTLSESISGTGFVISSTGKTCTTSLAAGASCVLPVEYDPTAVGSNTGTLTITTNGGSSPTVALSGTATSDVSISPTSLAFGTIKHATTKTLNLTISNVGKIASLTVSGAISGSGSADFAVLSTGNTCTSGVAPGKTCTLPIEFKPAAAAAYSATLTITTNGGANPTVALTGTGD
jgi:sugar lactone lactonase YvrE